MSDMIYRQDAIDAMCELMHHWFGGDPKDEVREIKRELEKLLSAQPERKKGKWIHGREVCREYMGTALITVQYSHWECSVCGYRTENEPIWKFCPNCGAYMRGGKDGLD